MQHTDTVVQENQDVCLLGLETSKTKEACTKGSYTVLQLRIRYLEKVCVQLLRPQKTTRKGRYPAVPECPRSIRVGLDQVS